MGLVSLLIALGVHLRIVIWLAVRPPDVPKGGAPDVEGAGPGSASGAPAKSQRVRHIFVVREFDEGHPVARARVRDVFSDEAVITTTDGIATVVTRAGAALLVQVEKPGYALHAERFANTDPKGAVHSVFLKRADVPYYMIDTIFLMRCLHCHGGPGSAGSIDLTSYDGLMRSRVGVTPIVVPGHPDSSILVRALTDSVGPRGKGAGTHIRRVGRFPELEVEYIIEWIREGAKGAVGRVVP